MDSLLLLYIITLLVAAYFGMSIVMKIIQSLPSLGPFIGNRPNKNQRSYTGRIFLFLFLLAILFWMLFEQSILN